MAKVYDERFYNALHDVAKALDKLVDLCYDEKMGDDFNVEILGGELSHVWATSIDEMAGDISTVATKMENEHKATKLKNSLPSALPYIN